MPDTQQEWLEGWLHEWLYDGGPLLKREHHDLAEALVSAWPSSPQGLAVKQMMDMLVRTRTAYRLSRPQVFGTDALEEDILAALEAARKAGVA